MAPAPDLQPAYHHFVRRHHVAATYDVTYAVSAIDEAAARAELADAEDACEAGDYEVDRRLHEIHHDDAQGSYDYRGPSRAKPGMTPETPLLAAYLNLHNIISDALEEGVLTDEVLPDHYHAIVNRLMAALRHGASDYVNTGEGFDKDAEVERYHREKKADEA